MPWQRLLSRTWVRKLKSRNLLLAGRGFYCPRAHLQLDVALDGGGLAPVEFMVDTGTDISMISTMDANDFSIPYLTHRPVPSVRLSGCSVQAYLDEITVSFNGMRHNWPCLFYEWPIVAAAAAPLPLLGRKGFLQDYAFEIGDAYFVVLRPGYLRRWWLMKRVR